MSDYETCADLCEDRGFPRQAALLRAVASGELRVFAVCERVLHEGDFQFSDYEGGVPVALFLVREDAERDARRRDVLGFRERNRYEYCEKDITYTTDQAVEEFEREVSAILGADYQLPDLDTHKGSLFPVDANDEMIRAIMRLVGIEFFYVAELEFVDRANP